MGVGHGQEPTCQTSLQKVIEVKGGEMTQPLKPKPCSNPFVSKPLLYITKVRKSRTLLLLVYVTVHGKTAHFADRLILK